MKVTDDSDLDLAGLSRADVLTYRLFMDYQRHNVLLGVGLLAMSVAAATLGPALFVGSEPVVIRDGYRAFLAVLIFVGFALVVVGVFAEMVLRTRIRRLTDAEEAAIEARIDTIVAGDSVDIPAGLTATEPVVVAEEPAR